MSAFRLSRFFSQPEILREIDPENLLSLLADHAAALAAFGLVLPGAASGAGLDYEKLARLLMEPDKLPAGLRDAFYFIHEMATPDGMACLTEAAEAAQPPIEIVGLPEVTPADVAVQVWLKDRELLERKHAEQFMYNARSFHSFGACVSPMPPPRDPMAAAPAIKRELDDYFEKKNRGRNTKVFPYVRVEGVMFLVRHGDPFKREGAIDSQGESYGAYYWPEKFAVLALDTAAGELRINARNKGERNEYRKVFGRHLFGSESFFTDENKYTLEPLRAVGVDAIAPVEGMDKVFLTEVHFDWGGTLDETEIRTADDVFAAYRARKQAFPEKPAIIKARFRITFSDSSTPRVVTVRPPNEAQYARDGDSEVVEWWLRVRGFSSTARPKRYEPAVDKVLVGV